MNNADFPAMPNSNPDTYPTACAVQWAYGLTKREELAARNMAAILGANPPHDVEHERMAEFMTVVAEYATLAADALLEELEKDMT